MAITKKNRCDAWKDTANQLAHLNERNAREYMELACAVCGVSTDDFEKLPSHNELLKKAWSGVLALEAANKKTPTT